MVRLYFYYMGLNLALDVGSTVLTFVNANVCAVVPNALAVHGAAFSCGVLRVAGVFAILMTMMVATYFFIIVWSYCEELKVTNGDAGLSTLMFGENQIKQRRKRMD